MLVYALTFFVSFFLEQCILGNVDLDGKLRFEAFDINTVLEKGEKLLGSAGEEYDFEDSTVAGLIYFIVLIFFFPAKFT